MNRSLIKTGQSYNIKLDETQDYDDNFDTLVEELSKKTSVVILIDEYATMFGYTQKELEENFCDYIEKGFASSGLSRDEYLSRLKSTYDGYRFATDAETVYNPVSIGSFFVNGGKSFNNFWAETGSMKLLMDIAQKVNFNIATSLEKPIVASNLLGMYGRADAVKRDFYPDDLAQSSSFRH